MINPSGLMLLWNLFTVQNSQEGIGNKLNPVEPPGHTQHRSAKQQPPSHPIGPATWADPTRTGTVPGDVLPDERRQQQRNVTSPDHPTWIIKNKNKIKTKYNILFKKYIFFGFVIFNQ